MLADIIAIGIDNYFDSKGRTVVEKTLRFAASDADKVLRTFGLLFQVRRGALLTDAPQSRISPTRNAIIRNLRDFANIAPGDMTALFVYFAGHGVGIDGTLHLCPSDYDSEISEYSSVSIGLACDLISARKGKKCFIFDCCRTSLGRSVDSSASKLIRVTVPIGDDLIILSGCSDGQWSYESNLISQPGGGVFTHELLSVLGHKAKSSGQGYFSLGEAFRMARDNTVQFVFDKAGFALQRPVALGGDLDDFYMKSK